VQNYHTPVSRVLIGRDSFTVSSLKEAVACWEATRDQYGWGASEAPLCSAYINGRLIRISYNGRCWNAATGEEVKP
jgi:hypothetical protein